jgi:hypothetical protein
MRDYQTVAAKFKEKGCQLLTTEDEFKKISGQPKYDYIAKCGHEHTVFYNVFCSRNTGVLCPKCVCIENGKKMKEQFKTKDKLGYIKLENQCIEYFMEQIQKEFICIKAFDGCKADFMIKPKNITEDLWIGIQAKTVAFSGQCYGFHLEQEYNDCLILCMCWDNKKTWVFPYDDVKHLTKISIGKGVSKYSVYEIKESDNLLDKINNYYKNMNQYNFDILDMPISIYQQREKIYREYRESKITFIKFLNNDIEGLPYDFKINDKKIQEKVGGVCKKQYIFHLCKNNGIVNKIRQFTSYKKDDNDYYWLNCPDKKYFYVFPQQILIDKDYLDKDKRMQIFLNPENTDYWYSEYMFDYENINKEKLLNLLQIEEEEEEENIENLVAKLTIS